MGEIRFVHFADLHLDTPFKGSFSPGTAKILKESLLRVFDNIIEYGNQNNIDIMLISGDLFDNTYVTKSTVDFIINRLKKYKGRCFIAAGNHDFLSSDSPYYNNNFPDNVHIFKDEIEKIELENVNIYGISFNNPVEDSPLLNGFKADTNKKSIMVMHGDIKSESRYNPISMEDIKDSNICYLALGHIHINGQAGMTGKTYYGYSGTPQGTNFKESGDFFVICGTINDDRVIINKVDLSDRKFIRLELDITNKMSHFEIEEDIKNILLTKNPEKNLFRIIFKGEISNDLILNTNAIIDNLKNNIFYLEIVDESHVKYDLNLILEEKSLRKEFVKLVLNEDINDEDKERYIKLGLRAFNPAVGEEELI